MDEQGIATYKLQTGESVSLNKPRLFASVKDEDRSDFDDWMRSNGYENRLMSLHPGSLSSLVKELIGEGQPIPESVTYYTKTGVTLRRNGR